jgi:signal transduction histidine kinase
VAHEITDISQIDAKGREQIFESRLGMSSVGSGRDRSQDPAFRNARPGQTWFSPVYFRKETEPYMTIAVRSGGASGPVTVADVNLKFMWDIITRIRIGQKGKAYVVDGSGHLIADPDIGLVLRKTDLSGLEQVKAALAEGADDSLAIEAQDLAGHAVLTAWAPIEPGREQPGRNAPVTPLGWKVFVEQPVSEVYSALDATILRTAALMVAGVLFSILAAMWLAGSMVRPIRTLQEGAQKIGEGDLDQSIRVRTGDELEALAEQFNSMTARLRESYSGLERKVEERTAELQQTLEQQTATSEILKVISSSTTDVQPVLDAIVQSAARLFAPHDAVIVMREGDLLYRRARAGPTKIDEAEMARIFPARYDPEKGLLSRAIAEKRILEVDDAQSLDQPELVRRAARAGNLRSVTLVPLMREGEAIGVLSIQCAESGRRLNAKQIELLRTFADQAVIAIENVRLFNQTKESLEQQTATAEILRVISDSPGEVKPILDAVAERAQRLCDSTSVGIYVLEGETLRRTAFHGPSELEGRETLPSVDDTLTGRTIASGKPIHIEDLERVQAEFPMTWEMAQRFGRQQTLLAVPLMSEGRPFGTMFLRRTEVRPFTERQIALSKVFADQAAIGIENVRLFNEIREKSAQLEIANKHKSDFLANMSHELRTPLNAIIGFSEVLSERMFGEINAKQADYLKDIHESGRHLLSLINDILDLSKIESGRMELELSTFDLPAAISNAMTLVRERALRHNIELTLAVDKGLGAFEADERKVKQILLNLLSNAVKFTPDGGKVSVFAKKDSTHVKIAVKDTGIGIAPEDQQKVFAEFVQVGRDYTRKAEGTGLGLALTKRFVELHGGEVRLESTVGKGSTFAFTLPIRQ